MAPVFGVLLGSCLALALLTFGLLYSRRRSGANCACDDDSGGIFYVG